eukprot:8079-Amphidinium_carterae.1
MGDPGDPLSDWFTTGAPAGVAVHPELDRTFPRKSEVQPETDFMDLYTDWTGFSNYRAFEDCDEAKDAVRGYVAQGYLEVLGSFDAATERLGGPPVLSKFGVIEKVRDGRVKRRVILDARQSGLTSSSSSKYHVALPRATDIVNAVLRSAQSVDARHIDLW